MTAICHDWEFYEDGKTIRPIAVGLVTGVADYYAIFEDALAPANMSTWLTENVFKHIKTPLLRPSEFRAVKPRSTIAREVKEFITSFEDVNLWADYGAYDHVVLAQTLGGTMINLPQGIPMHTNDIQTLKMIVQRKNSRKDFENIEKDKPVQDPKTLHHALYDARYDYDLFRHYMDYI